MRPEVRLMWAFVWVVSALLGSAWIVYSRESAPLPLDTNALPAGPLSGYLAPDFSLTNLQGEEVNLSDLRGRPIILNFWATWCGPCRIEMPDLQNVWRQYNGSVLVIGVNNSEPADRVTSFILEMGVTYPILLDDSAATASLYQVSALPSTFFIDSQGVVQDRIIGIVNEAVMLDRLEKMLP